MDFEAVADDRPALRSLHNLPAELIDHILTYLAPVDLASISLTCRLFYNHTLSNTIWLPHITTAIHHTLAATPPPHKSYRDLYAAHHPFWFLTKHKIWFADTQHVGKLVLCRYSAERDCIEGYSIVAERGSHTFQFWEWDREVIIHTFSPRVRLDTDAPVIRLNACAYNEVRESVRQGKGMWYGEEVELGDGEEEEEMRTRLAYEVPMQTFAHGSEQGGPGASLHSRFMLTRPLPEELVRPGTAVWPPLIIPTPSEVDRTARRGSRTRNSSVQQYRGASHKPSRWSEVNEAAFRLRRWMQFSGYHMRHMTAHFLQNNNLTVTGSLGTVNFGGGVSARVGESVTTFATIDREAYTPTKKKPWRGIWVGDYSGHGCEFLVVLQPDDGEVKRPLPDNAARLLREMDNRERRRNALRRNEATPMSWADLEEHLSTDSSPSGPSSADVGFNGHAQHASAAALQDHELLTTDSAYAVDLHAADDDGELGHVEFFEHDDNPVRLTDENAVGDSDEDIYQGRIEAVKLTGDPNIPRGEYTFIAPDIGPNGLVRIAQEKIFRGARVVRSVGHIAAREFREGQCRNLYLFRVTKR